MATLKTIRKRITSVKNTQKITRAMKMVAAAKLRRAQSALAQARPHAEFLTQSLTRMVGSLEAYHHPMIRERDPVQKAHLLVLTSDRGLCGGFNGNLLRQAEHWIDHEGKAYEEIGLSVLGRKGRDFYKAKKRSLEMGEPWPETLNSFAGARDMAESWLKRYREGEFDAFYLAYNHFRSAISQVPTIRQIFPMDLKPDPDHLPGPISFEGEPQLILDQILHRQVATLFYLAVLESQASELGARMSAMDNATNNANEMLDQLTLQYNRARQAAITLELMDIVNGAEAL
jgi:F-type H+-transporting ATPase subunit gamma